MKICAPPWLSGAAPLSEREGRRIDVGERRSISFANT
jgi:hypothetical protein